MSSGTLKLICPLSLTCGSGKLGTPFARMHCAYFRPASFPPVLALAEALGLPPPAVATPPFSSFLPQPARLSASSRPSTSPALIRMAVSFVVGRPAPCPVAQPGEQARHFAGVSATLTPR